MISEVILDFMKKMCLYNFYIHLNFHQNRFSNECSRKKELIFRLTHNQNYVLFKSSLSNTSKLIELKGMQLNLDFYNVVGKQCVDQHNIFI